MLSFDVSERTVSRMMPRRPADPEAQQRWRNLLRIHREVLAVIVLNERHLHRLLSEFVAYDHDDRSHRLATRARPPKGVIERPGLSFGERQPLQDQPIAQ